MEARLPGTSMHQVLAGVVVRPLPSEGEVGFNKTSPLRFKPTSALAVCFLLLHTLSPGYSSHSLMLSKHVVRRLSEYKRLCPESPQAQTEEQW